MSIELDVTFPEELWDPTKGGAQSYPDGVYVCVAKGIELKTKAESGKSRYEVQSEIDEGELKGTPINPVLFADFSKAANVKKLKTCLVSCGIPPSKLVGKAKFDLGAIVGRKFLVLVRNAPEGEVDAQGRRPLPDVDFITKEQAAEYAKSPAKPARSRKAAAEGNGATPPSGTAAPTEDLKSLFGT